MNDLLTTTATQWAHLLRKGEISSLELTQTCLEEIEKKNSSICAFVQILRRSALKAAKEADKRFIEAKKNNSLDLLPLYNGVPIAIKDLSPLKGSFTRLGSRSFKYLYTPFDGWMARRMKQAGLVILGKLSTSEFGALPITEPLIHPPTRNPWDQNYSAGGSSGGSGAAVAAGLVPFAQGSDGAGSIRIPASFCHCFGFKPSKSQGLNPAPQFDKLDMAVVGPLSKTVEDAAGMMDILTGKYSGSSRVKHSFLDRYQQAPKSLKIKMCTDGPITKTEPQIKKRVESVAKILEEMGHIIEPVGGVDSTVEDFLPLWQRQMANIPLCQEEKLGAVTRWLRAGGRELTKEEVVEKKDLLAQKIDDWIGEADVMLTPTVAVYPPKIGQWNDLDPAKTFEKAADIGAFTAAFNVCGGAAASIPGGISSDGLPFGIQIGSRDRSDGLILALSKQLEEVIPWT